MPDSPSRPTDDSNAPGAAELPPRERPGPPQPIDRPVPYRYHERRVLALAIFCGGIAGAGLVKFETTLMATWLSLAAALCGLGLLRHYRWARAFGRVIFTWIMILGVYWLIIDAFNHRFDFNVLIFAVLGIVGAYELWRWPLPDPEQEQIAHHHPAA